MNNLVIVGRLMDDIKIDNNKCTFTLCVPRQLKNEEGIYENDYIDVICSNNIAKQMMEYCKKGDLIGAKGNLRTNIKEGIKATYVSADRITFLSSINKGGEK